MVLVLPALGLTQKPPANRSPGNPPQTTLFVTCTDGQKAKHVLSPVSLSEGGQWRSYVQVDVQADQGCMHTTRLWLARMGEPYRLVYLMPPKRTTAGNGMEILGWAKASCMILVKTEEWQDGSDAPDTQQVLAIDAETGLVYEPELQAMLQARKDRQCSFRVANAGFSAEKNIDILVRAQFSTAMDVDQTEQDIPPAKRCQKAEETWSFNFATGEVRQVTNTQPLELFKSFLPKQGNN
ncbi:MAG: hypothetical protein WBW33_20000 [Bryobacteraceae bacterium]